MGKQNSSLALEEMTGSDYDLENLIHVRNLSICDSSTEKQPIQVVQVRGSITVSF